MSEIRISVIVPIYNMENYIKNCMDSILHQDIQDIEVLLIDDGSTDASAEICDEYDNLYRFVHVIHQENMGLSGARNTGIKYASGRWLLIIDPDDWLVDGSLKKIYEFGEKWNSDIIIGSFYSYLPTRTVKDSFFTLNEFHYEEQRDKEKVEYNCISNNEIGNLKCSTNVGVTWARLYNIQFLRKNKLSFIVGLNRTQDAIFNLYAFDMAKRIDFVDLPVQYYRVWDGSASRKYDPNFTNTANKIGQEIKKFIKIRGKDNYLRQAYYGKMIRLLNEIIWKEIVPRENVQDYAEKRKKLILTVKSEEYLNSLKNIELRTIKNSHKAVVVLLRLGLYDAVLIGCSVEKKIKSRL